MTTRIHSRSVRRAARALVASVAVSLSALPFFAQSAQAAAPTGCTSPKTAVAGMSDVSGSAQPTVTFVYTATKARSSGDILLWAYPASNTTLGSKNAAWLASNATVTINSNVMPSGLVHSSYSSVYAGAIQINLASTYTLSSGDSVEITVASGAFTTAAGGGPFTWYWRTATSSGADDECFTATVSVAGAPSTTVAPSTTTTVAPTTTTTIAPTTTVAAPTTTVAGATTTTVGATTTTVDLAATSGLALGAGAPRGAVAEELASSGADTTIQMMMAALVIALGVVVRRRRADA